MSTKMAVVLKPLQKDALDAALKGDLLCVLPTGYGKTLIIESIPQVNNRIVIVVNPLNCIMDQQEAKFGDECLRMSEKFLQSSDREQVVSEKISCGKLKYVLIHPEHAVQSQFKKLLMNTDLSTKVSHLIVDEVHCVLAWGKSDFRPAYTKLGLLRAVLPNAYVLGLTATATEKAQQEIMKALNMIDAKIIRASPDRPNVYLQVKRRLPSTGGSYSADSSFCDIADELLQELKERQIQFPKTILYVPLKWCGMLHERAKNKYGVGHMVAQYHAPQSQQMKTHIVSEMKTEECTIRLLFATEACRMGVDINDIRIVIHISPPTNIDTLLQEIGRCGRDGIESSSTIYYNSSDIAQNKTHIQPEIRTYLQTNGCRREFVLNHYGFCKVVMNQHCCDNCSSDDCKPNDTEKLPDTETFSSKQKEIAKSMLRLYFREENKDSGVFTPQLRSALSEKLVNDLCCNLETYSHIEQLKQFLPHLQLSFVENIFKIKITVKKLKI